MSAHLHSNPPPANTGGKNNHKGIFLDRDGTLIKHIPYLHNPAEVKLLPSVAEALALWLANGFNVYLFSNQSGVGRGMFGMDAVNACNARMFALLADTANNNAANSALAKGEGIFSGICMATGAPAGEDAGPSQGIDPYRKPSPKFINEMVAQHGLTPAQCYMAGDNLSDLQTGINAGTQAAFVQTGHAATEAVHTYCAQHNIPAYPNLLAFAQATVSAAKK